jgi:hypothetical protein
MSGYLPWVYCGRWISAFYLALIEGDLDSYEVGGVPAHYIASAI